MEEFLQHARVLECVLGQLLGDVRLQLLRPVAAGPVLAGGGGDEGCPGMDPDPEVLRGERERADGKSPDGLRQQRHNATRRGRRRGGGAVAASRAAARCLAAATSKARTSAMGRGGVFATGFGKEEGRGGWCSERRTSPIYHPATHMAVAFFFSFYRR